MNEVVSGFNKFFVSVEPKLAEKNQLLEEGETVNDHGIQALFLFKTN